MKASQSHYGLVVVLFITIVSTTLITACAAPPLIRPESVVTSISQAETPLATNPPPLAEATKPRPSPTATMQGDGATAITLLPTPSPTYTPVVIKTVQAPIALDHVPSLEPVPSPINKPVAALNQNLQTIIFTASSE